MALIPITGFPSTYRVPATVGEILFAQGPSTSGAGSRFAFFCGPMLASGSYTPNTVYAVKNENESITGAGAGSPCHQFIRAYLKANKSGKVFLLPHLPTSGGSATAATGTITFTGSATARGLASVSLAGEDFDTAINLNDGYAAIASNVADGINARTFLPFTASASIHGVLTLLAKTPGSSQNNVLRFRASVTGGVGVAVSTSGATLTGGVDGTTTENSLYDAALTTVDATRYYYMGTHATDSVNIATLALHISNKSQPNPGNRSVGVAFTPVSLASAITLAVARNYERLTLLWQVNADNTPAFIVGNNIAVRQKLEELDCATNFDGFRDSNSWFVRPAYSKTDWMDSDDLNDAITNGLSPINSDQLGSYWVMSTTTRSKDATGAFDDFRATETHRVSTMDLLLDTVIIRDVNTYSGFKLQDDKYLSDGVTVDMNQILAAKVLTPFTYKPFLKQIINQFAPGRLKNVADTIASLQVNLDPSNGGRLEVGISADTINLKHQTTVRISEVSAG